MPSDPQTTAHKNAMEWLLSWLEQKSGLHIHWHKAWDTHPNFALVFRCRCGHEVKSSI